MDAWMGGWMGHTHINLVLLQVADPDEISKRSEVQHSVKKKAKTRQNEEHERKQRRLSDVEATQQGVNYLYRYAYVT